MDVFETLYNLLMLFVTVRLPLVPPTAKTIIHCHKSFLYHAVNNYQQLQSLIVSFITGRRHESQPAGIVFHGPIFGYFAPQGRHVAPIKVKFGREETSPSNFTLIGATGLYLLTQLTRLRIDWISFGRIKR